MSAAAFDWKNPIYAPVFSQRAARLARLREDSALLRNVRAHYRTHIDDYINDWGVTVDTRVAATGRAPIMPMLLWPRQREYIQWLYSRWRANESATVVKSRDVGISWLAMGFSVALCTLYDDLSIGFGSEKQDKVDRSGDPDCLFYKGRMFLQYLPPEFRGGWHHKHNSAFMRLTFPSTGGSITGEAGDNIGRGGRKAIYFVDESAHIPNPKALDASLIANTECRIDMSSVKGMANSFAERAHNAEIPRFDFAMEDDPRRDDAYWKRKRETTDPVIFASEFERNFSASVEGVVIPSELVTAVVDAHIKLGLVPTGGVRRGSMDVADSGADANAFAVRNDFLVEHVESWKGSNNVTIYDSVERSFLLTDLHSLDGFHYDADGLGAGVRGDAIKINENRQANGSPVRTVTMFRGSAEVFEPEEKVIGTERTADDFFENLKAQSWWLLRDRFQYTYGVLAHFREFGMLPEIDLTRIISISSKFKESSRLRVELSQPVWATSKRGKVMVDKCPVGTKTEVRAAIKSPNLADAVMMLFAPFRPPMVIHPSLFQGLAHVPQRRF